MVHSKLIKLDVSISENYEIWFWLSLSNIKKEI